MRAVTALVALTLAAGCDRGSGESTAPATPQAMDGHECAACGMTVRDQPSPRGQVLHRDGTRAFFCSIGDMVTYLAAPSPHGEPRGVWVEANDPAADPMPPDTAARPWVTAQSASYVLGVPRERIMGAPVVVYAARGDADRVAGAAPGRRATDFEGLKRSVGESAHAH